MVLHGGLLAADPDRDGDVAAEIARRSTDRRLVSERGAETRSPQCDDLAGIGSVNQTEIVVARVEGRRVAAAGSVQGQDAKCGLHHCHLRLGAGLTIVGDAEGGVARGCRGGQNGGALGGRTVVRDGLIRFPVRAGDVDCDARQGFVESRKLWADAIWEAPMFLPYMTKMEI